MAAGRKRRRLGLEALEPRCLLVAEPLGDSVVEPAQGESAAEVSVAELATRLRNQRVTGATIITHGFQFSDSGGDSLLTLAQAITARADGQNGASDTAWLLNYSLVDHAGRIEGVFETAPSILPAPGTSGAGEVVLLFDWARESNEPSSGWGDAAGDALFNLIVELGLASPETHTSVPLHMIGHSFGTAVTSEAVERLAAFQIPVDQLTYLDPHDFDQGILPIDGKQRLFELGRPDGYGAAVWNNVSFADVYYQTEFAPDGRPIPGARNQLVNDQVSGIDAHSDVWNIFYLGTVQDANSLNGYGFSRIAGKPRVSLLSNDQKAYRYFSDPAAAQNHSHSPTSWTDQGRELTGEELNFARWPPRWNPYEIANGDFEDSGDELVPGWIDHGGGRTIVGTCAAPCGDAIDGSLVLSSRTVSRTHNRFYVPATAKTVELDLRRGIISADDQFVVRLDDQILGSWPLSTIDPVITTRGMHIPKALRGRSHTLELAIESKVGGVEGAVRVDNLRMSPNGNEPPTEIQLSPSNLPERTAGATIGMLTARDEDPGQTITFSTSDPRFEIAGGLLRLRAGQFVEMSTSPLAIEVTATDSGTTPGSTTVTLQVTITSNPFPWRNAELAEDVDRSGLVVPLDVLLIINELNAPTTIRGDWSLPRAKPASWPWYYDVNGDGYCTPLDVLQVINWLNGPSSSSARRA